MNNISKETFSNEHITRYEYEDGGTGTWFEKGFKLNIDDLNALVKKSYDSYIQELEDRIKRGRKLQEMLKAEGEGVRDFSDYSTELQSYIKEFFSEEELEGIV